MTKYTNNEQYENDKARLINILIGGGVEDFAVNLLKQSKWIGAYPTENDIKTSKKLSSIPMLTAESLTIGTCSRS